MARRGVVVSILPTIAYGVVQDISGVHGRDLPTGVIVYFVCASMQVAL